MPPDRTTGPPIRWPPLFPAKTWRRLVKRLGLSKRQAEVAELLCRECLVDDIASELGISPDAVRHHAKRLFHKLKVKSRVGVVLRMVHAEHGLSAERRRMQDRRRS